MENFQSDNLFKHSSYEERAKCIDMIVKNHKESTTFEEFASHIISPVQPTHLFSGPSSMTGEKTKKFLSQPLQLENV